jgi:Fe-S-cluster-containing hydrogenase component 2
MGHLVEKELFRKLGKKIDGLETRAPWNDKLYAVLKELYSADEAELVIKMPYGLSTFEQLAKVTGFETANLRRLLDGLTAKGLVMDIWINEAYHYIPSPIMIGIFEFTMMRVGPDLNSREWAKLLHEYMDDAFYGANWGGDTQFSIYRALPYEEAVKQEEFAEVLDYEKASEIIEGADKLCIGLCSCRHQKKHLGEELCAAPMETCTQFGYAAEMMIRNKLGREVTKSEMKEHFARSRELGLVLTADNVQKNMRFVCHCCACCCELLQGIRKHGFSNLIVTSNYLAGIDSESCVGCGKCSKACPIGAIAMGEAVRPESKRKKDATVNEELCLGCGVCALACPKQACKLEKRGQRVIHPETTFERIMLECLEKGTLQNQIFDDPNRVDQKFMRAFVGAFLRLPPVKKALLSDKMRSGFLNAMKDGVRKQGKEWILKM